MTTAKNPHTGQPYRGWKSTKLHLSLIAMGLISGAYALTGFNEHLFDPFVMGVLGGAAIYSGTNTWEKRGRAPPAPELAPYSPPPPPPQELPREL